MPRRFKKIDKVFEKIIGRSEIESISSNENEKENDVIENDYLDEEPKLNNCSRNSDYFLEGIYNIFSHLQNIIKFIFGASGIYLIWICLHYFASHLYVKFCVPTTVMGFILSPFMTATPHCQGLRWVVYNAANMINNMWLVLGTWVGSMLLNFNTYKPPDISS
jgi:hypothetical protein